MDILTDEEVNLLAQALEKPEENMSQEEIVESHFKNALNYIRSNPKFMEMSVEDIFRWFYLLGINTDSPSKEVTIKDIAYLLNEVNNNLDNTIFQNDIMNAIENPNSLPDNLVLSLDDENNKVTLTADCQGYNCSCSPQREDHCMSEVEGKCVFTIPMKNFNEMIGVKDN